MTRYNFTLYFTGPDITAKKHIDKLYVAGCDDATFGSDGSFGSAEFDREAKSFSEAILSAIESVEAAVAGLQVTQVEQDDLVNAATLARRTGRSRESIRLLACGKRGPGGFPKPIHWPTQRQALWTWGDVVRWFADSLGERIGDPEQVEFLSALNSQLETRRRLAKLSKTGRSAIQSIAA